MPRVRKSGGTYVGQDLRLHNGAFTVTLAVVGECELNGTTDYLEVVIDHSASAALALNYFADYSPNLIVWLILAS